ncbi:hypothetical protein VPH35_010633 [Triticum aestivum]|uniref:Inositol polyphosphate-related phosphatase domain-containing protein n=1 Tax=Triticum turgidum subsp. durum TaxID=4567 RepID=A0A9R0R486_TRITD|nr:type I inositol polyphosphate 5-phosphatase 1-like isoform X2 [Triticum aestivum]VAH22015.1 unnamed protein product [Triticum turgidum subsp. durum]
MASSSSPAAPLLPPCQDEQDKEDAGARSDGGSQREQGVMRSWAEAALLCCGADCGDAERLWRRVVLRKWLNVGAGSGDSDFSADEFEAEAETDDEEPGHQEKCCCWEHKLFDEERRSRGLGAGTIGNQVKAVPDRLKRCNSETLRAQYIDVAELRIFVGTWNVGGRVPPTDLDIQEWLAMEEPADIYVLGFQEIVPLNAGNIFGAEDDHPVVVWEHIIRETLNKICPYKPKHKCVSDPPSPSKFNPSDYLVMEDDFLSEADNGSEGELHPLIGQDINPVTNDSGVCKTYEYSTSASSERVHEGEDFSKMLPVNTSHHSHNSSHTLFRSNLKEPSNQAGHLERPGMIWPEQQLDMQVHLLQDSTSVTSVKTLTASASFKSRHENSNGFPEDNLDHDVSIDNRVVERKNSNFVRIISKQMVGIYLSVWVQRGLRRHIQNLRVSTVGVGAMGYIGNKGSISVSMSIYQTPFCFVCCHLTSGEKDGNLTKRNADVEEILRRTVFNPVHRVSMPKGIHDHEKIIWFGDLNYRINLSYERTHELISRKEWDLLFDNDQLKWELMKGRTFDGWIEGVISFPPTYKYEFNSDKYAGDEPISARRRPAWCDRILSYGKGIRLDSYRRVELNLSDHRPVSAVYMAEVEVLCHRKFQKAVTFTNVEVEDHLLLER